jgi:hypothetical protein
MDRSHGGTVRSETSQSSLQRNAEHPKNAEKDNVVLHPNQSAQSCQ